MDDVFFMIYCFCKNFLFYNKFSNIYLIDTVTVVFFSKKMILELNLCCMFVSNIYSIN